ncbi:MAG: TIGR03089 family protein [Dermatophilus congolensis]|nr:TIGR03089 family protein [Dermatophilus congolensis]
MFDTSSLLQRLTTDNPTAPRITHYDEAGRIELSGRVLVNWVAKAANLLVEEFDVQPSDVLVLDLPAGHWRATYWALAAWLCGAHVVVTDARWSQSATAPLAENPDVVVTSAPARWADSGAEVVAVETRALARSFEGDLAGAFDEAANLATYADVPPDPDGPVPDDAALSDLGYTLTYRELPTPHEGGRVLLPLSAEAVPLQVVALILAVLAADGSVVCVHTTEQGPDVDRLAADEQAVVVRL